MKRFAFLCLCLIVFVVSVFQVRAQMRAVQAERNAPAAMAALSNSSSVQPKQQPFKGTFYNEENRVTIVLNLYEATLFAPNYGFLGELNGFMHGSGIYGMWFTTSHKIEGNTATLRMSNDIGSDAQTIVFHQLTDSTFSYKAVGGNEVKKAVGRKLVHIPSGMVFKKYSAF